MFVTTLRTASVTPGARETRHRTILAKNCRVRAPATYAWCVKSGERKRERTRVTIVAERGHDTGGKKKKEKRKRSVKEACNRGCTKQTDRRTNPATTTVREKTSTHFTLDGRSRPIGWLAHSLPFFLLLSPEAPSLVFSRESGAPSTTFHGCRYFAFR